MDFSLKFTLTSYASILFFALGLRLAFQQRWDMNLARLILIFMAVAIPLSAIFIREPLGERLFISLVWTSSIAMGFRFGRKIRS